MEHVEQPTTPQTSENKKKPAALQERIAEVYETYRRALIMVAMDNLPPHERDLNTAEDIVQEAFHSLLRSKTLPEDLPFSYVRGTVVHRAKDRQRARETRPDISRREDVPSDTSLDKITFSQEPDAPTIILRAEAEAKLHELIAALKNETDRRIAHLVIVDGRSEPDAARELGLTYDFVHHAINRHIRPHLKKGLTAYEEGLVFVAA